MSVCLPCWFSLSLRMAVSMLSTLAFAAPSIAPLFDYLDIRHAQLLSREAVGSNSFSTEADGIRLTHTATACCIYTRTRGEARTRRAGCLVFLPGFAPRPASRQSFCCRVHGAEADVAIGSSTSAGKPIRVALLASAEGSGYVRITFITTPFKR